MRSLKIIALILIPLVVTAKVADFNVLIKETQDSQEQLHSELRSNLDITRIAVRNTPPENVNSEPQQAIVGNENQINAPTAKEILKFEKEKQHFRASQKKQDERLAEELKEENLSR